ncbi:hypothetical protein L6164_023486 [Bauhinia variegata]|uniref:Uncharacterized protein n=1 Tax=Bauhinia variegata TaxID=167791 RepID=A0ACB9MJQ7_BAUVA|nr:hypothetical protein L6164_023486 [Bauhinia variegata]
MNNITMVAYSLSNYTNMAESFNRCSYSFVHKSDGGFGYKLSAHDVKHGLPFERAPMVLDWAIGTENGTCNACRSNSYCNDTQTGYRLTHNCISKDNCRNTNESFVCFCKKGYSGKGTKEAECQKESLVTRVVTIASAGLIVLLIGMSVTYMVYQKKKLVKLKEKFFRQNGGFILLQQLFIRKDSSQGRAQIFMAEELKKATKNYNESLIIGKGGYGTVFKGFLADNRIVAVKKSKIVDQSQIEQFINEVVILSQINHRNVVKLLGCCLRTEVPLLVYEFVNNGTLYDYIHNESKENNVYWKTHLRISAEAAGALAYLHSAASIPIIHRDVKTANILLNETYTAKVSDFGASRLVPIDRAEITTMVQGTIGYLDPEYMQTSHLTEKSDVYSFGVVLVELLTGEKAFSFVRPEEKRSLSMHFLLAFKEGCLFEVLENGIVNEENKEEVMEVAALASKCLRLIGEERPSMKEVAMELEGIRKTNKHPWDSSNIERNLENEYLLHEKSGLYKHGESSSLQNTGYDSIRDQVLIPLDDGR